MDLNGQSCAHSPGPQAHFSRWNAPLARRDESLGLGATAMVALP